MSFVRVLLAVLVSFACAGCKRKASSAQCDQLLDRFALLVVKETHADASAAMIQAEQARERSEAKSDDAFRNCTTEVSAEEFDCAIVAASPDKLLKCLE